MMIIGNPLEVQRLLLIRQSNTTVRLGNVVQGL